MYPIRTTYFPILTTCVICRSREMQDVGLKSRFKPLRCCNALWTILVFMHSIVRPHLDGWMKRPPSRLGPHLVLRKGLSVISAWRLAALAGQASTPKQKRRSSPAPPGTPTFSPRNTHAFHALHPLFSPLSSLSASIITSYRSESSTPPGQTRKRVSNAVVIQTRRCINTIPGLLLMCIYPMRLLFRQTLRRSCVKRLAMGGLSVLPNLCTEKNRYAAPSVWNARDLAERQIAGPRFGPTAATHKLLRLC
ncbi:hypothetical protein K469DRAFT_376563 [Zopfia rhizophila CBS 207.26]|uniref:Uncharacterized protein n=1 Tax=Zopfia rhizophila CBS 207.26 TaxID=1314779 RepID=A0A6A6DG25_9PEZI|nr:hypothetical protein K469DRAFT_376563 [Zopfia rhizophila CBS 207.26]